MNPLALALGAAAAAAWSRLAAAMCCCGEPCAARGTRRRELIRRRAPLAGRWMLRRQLVNYAGVEGSDKYRQFAEASRAYLMTAAVKA